MGVVGGKRENWHTARTQTPGVERETSPYSRWKRNTTKKAFFAGCRKETRILQRGKLPNPRHLQTALWPPFSSRARDSVFPSLRDTPLLPNANLSHPPLSLSLPLSLFLSLSAFRTILPESTLSRHRIGAVIARSFFLRNKYVSRGKQEAISVGLSGQTTSAISFRAFVGGGGTNLPNDPWESVPKSRERLPATRRLISIARLSVICVRVNVTANLILSGRDLFYPVERGGLIQLGRIDNCYEND